jgi:hypothetical protein
MDCPENRKLRELLKQSIEYINDLAEPELHPGYKEYYNFMKKVKDILNEKENR